MVCYRPSTIRASKAEPFTDEKQANLLLSGVTTMDNPAARNWFLDVTSYAYAMGVTNQELINRAALGHQPGPGEHDPRNDVLTSAKRAEERKHAKYDAICAATGGGVYVVSFRARNDGRARVLYRGGVVSPGRGHSFRSQHPSQASLRPLCRAAV